MSARNLLIGIVGTGLLLAAASAQASGRLAHERSDHREQEFAFSPGTLLRVNLFHGDVTVRAASGSKVRLLIDERMSARTAEDLDRAAGETRLATNATDGRIEICANGPFRPQGCGDTWTRWHGESRYTVRYDLILEVPDGIETELATINGDVRVERLVGDFEVRSVNGTVEMEHVDGSGYAGTVNGGVTVRFDHSPERDSSFRTVNGEIDVSFPGDFSAELHFDTMHGEILSDFPYEALPATVETEKRGRGTRFRVGADSRVRIANGGPLHDFSSINGDILIRREVR